MSFNVFHSVEVMIWSWAFCALTDPSVALCQCPTRPHSNIADGLNSFWWNVKQGHSDLSQLSDVFLQRGVRVGVIPWESLSLQSGPHGVFLGPCFPRNGRAMQSSVSSSDDSLMIMSSCMFACARPGLNWQFGLMAWAFLWASSSGRKWIPRRSLERAVLPSVFD